MKGLMLKHRRRLNENHERAFRFQRQRREARRAPCIAPPRDKPKYAPGDLPQSVLDMTAAVLGDAMVCTRTWQAWSYGTMGPDDFHNIGSDENWVNDVAQAVIAAWEATK